ncbi:MAG: hypothetical protein LUE89_06390 [Clostridiales bacterium]|nr:hypothetical protein [Clostridiales bacterium]
MKKKLFVFVLLCLVFLPAMVSCSNSQTAPVSTEVQTEDSQESHETQDLTEEQEIQESQAAQETQEPQEEQETQEAQESKESSRTTTYTSFTNKYGTRTTKCAHEGCTNYIASSGDTNCCTTHSNRCGGCGCYIDEDALFCIDCLVDALEQQQQVNSTN